MSNDKAVWAAETLTTVLSMTHIAKRAANHAGIQRIILSDPELREEVGKEVLACLVESAGKPGLQSIVFQDESFRAFIAQEVLKSLIQTLDLTAEKP